jgi:LacI family transcriptional regulator
LGYRAGRTERPVSTRDTGALALIVADIVNPVLVGRIRGAERKASEHGLTLAVIETQVSQRPIEEPWRRKRNAV